MQNDEYKILKSKNVKSAYIHIPFCRQKCRYCAFTSFQGINFIDDYIKKLSAEINHYYLKTPLKTLYIGGGTPSLLNEKQLQKIFSKFEFEKNCEITFEINPDSTNLKLLSLLRNFNVNRLSIGIQSFNDEILKNIGRLHSAKGAKDTVYLAQDLGFDNISIDLIYGLPGQNMSDWENTLKTAKNLGIQHISLYGLKIEENTFFYKNKPKNLPTEDIQADMYEFAVKYLAPEFDLYEISNFERVSADRSFKSRHNSNYWNEGEYFGFGLSASGFSGGVRYKNTVNYKKYCTDPLYTKELEVLTPQNMLEETIFLGLRKKEGINIKEINEKFGIDFFEKFGKTIEKFISTGHLEKTENGVKLSLKGVLVSNLILCEFLC